MAALLCMLGLLTLSASPPPSAAPAPTAGPRGMTASDVIHAFTLPASRHRLQVFDGGSVAEAASHAELLQCGGLYAAMWQHQLEGPSFSQQQEAFQRASQREEHDDTGGWVPAGRWGRVAGTIAACFPHDCVFSAFGAASGGLPACLPACPPAGVPVAGLPLSLTASLLSLSLSVPLQAIRQRRLPPLPRRRRRRRAPLRCTRERTLMRTRWVLLNPATGAVGCCWVGGGGACRFLAVLCSCSQLVVVVQPQWRTVRAKPSTPLPPLSSAPPFCRPCSVPSPPLAPRQMGCLPACLPAAAAATRTDVGSCAPRCGLGGAASR